jgi:hypothetical protein
MEKGGRSGPLSPRATVYTQIERSSLTLLKKEGTDPSLFKVLLFKADLGGSANEND